MSVYDPEDNEQDLNSLTPDELSGLEQKYSTGADEREDKKIEGGANPDDMARGGMGRKLRQFGQTKQAKKDAEEQQDLDNRLGNIKDGLGESGLKGGFFKNGKGGKAAKSSNLGGVLKNRKILLGVGGGAIGLLFAVGVLFNLLQNFQLDNFFKNIDSKTSQRLSASLDTRNQHLVKAYMQIRVLEIEGKTQNDNLFFSADRVETNKPLTDWYRTMRKSKFEKDLLDKQGIKFVSVVGPDGKVDVARITRQDGVPDDIKQRLDATGNDSVKVKALLNDFTPDEMDKAFTVDKFGSHKDARKSVKKAVNSEVPWYRTFKRRHIRKDVANTTGIKEWRLFEKTREKVAKKKQDIRDRLLNKIIDRYYINNPSSAQFMKCLFSDGRCPSNTDTSSPDAKTATPATGEATPPDTQLEEGAEEAASLETKQVGDEISEGIASEVKDGIAQETEEELGEALIQFGPGQKIILAVVRTLTKEAGTSTIPDPTKVWTWAKRLAKIHALIGQEQVKDLVMNSRRSQAMGVSAVYSIANDQIKAGQLVGDELRAFFDTTKNLGNSEGWMVANGKMSGDSKSNAKKDAYCKKDISDRTFEEFAWQCDDQKPNGGSTAGDITKGYQESVGYIIAPIADGVNAVQDSFPGKIVDKAVELVDSAIGLVVDKPLEAVMEKTGLGDKIQDVLGFAMIRVLGFLGAGPMFDGTQPGLANTLITGSAATAETSTRASGGIRSTPQSLAYTNQLAADYNTEQKSQMSVYDRYASLDNPDSFASSTLFTAANNTSLSGGLSKIAQTVTSLPKLLGNIVSGRAFAQQKVTGSTLADWSGVDKYDIPPECINLKPLDPDYEKKSTNAAQVLSSYGVNGYTADMATLRDTDKFMASVYEKINSNDAAKAKAQEIAEKIYSCALFDARGMGSLGYVYGYEDDNGYGEKSSTGTPAGVTGILAPGAFSWPEKIPTTILDCFGTRGGAHKGIDMQAGGTGSPIFASADGIVTHVKDVDGYGPNFVAIKHDNGYSTSYGHMSKALVKVDDTVTQGQQIGEEGNEGIGSRGSHLHFNVFPDTYTGWDTPNIDPLKNGLKIPEGVTNTAGCATS